LLSFPLYLVPGLGQGCIHLAREGCRDPRHCEHVVVESAVDPEGLPGSLQGISVMKHVKSVVLALALASGPGPRRRH